MSNETCRGASAKRPNESALDTTAATTRLPYFRTAERIDALKNQLQQWSGTRWQHAGNRPNEMRCGITGDCLFWVHVFKAIGALPSGLEVPRYRSMEAAADKMKLLRERIQATGVAELVWCSGGSVNRRDDDSARATSAATTAFRMGDVLLFKNGMSGAHCGLVVQTAPLHFVHLSKNGLNEEPFQQGHWIAALAYVYRLLEEEGYSGGSVNRRDDSAIETRAATQATPAGVAA